MYRTRNTNYQKILLEQEKRIFKTSDLAVLWKIENKNTLLTTIKRYIKKNILYRIHKGLYSTVELKKLHPYELGCAWAGSFSYVSTETILQNEGVITQNIEAITLLGKKEKTITINNNKYLCRRLNPKYLLNRVGITESNIHAIATLDRAIADTLHRSPHYYFDNQLAIKSVNVAKIEKKLGYKERPNHK